MDLVYSIAGLCVLLILWYYLRKTKTSKLPLPPGPKGLPIIGNLFDVPSDKPWLVYDEWFRKYGTHPFVYKSQLHYIDNGFSLRRYHPYESTGAAYNPPWICRKMLRPFWKKIVLVLWSYSPTDAQRVVRSSCPLINLCQGTQIICTRMGWEYNMTVLRVCSFIFTVHFFCIDKQLSRRNLSSMGHGGVGIAAVSTNSSIPQLLSNIGLSNSRKPVHSFIVC